MDEGFAAALDGTALYYRVVGDGPSTLVVPNACWLETALAPLARGFRLVLFDLRSRGRSGRAEPSRLSVDWDAQDIEAVRRHLGLERFDLLGHSYLGLVVSLYAAAHPDRIRRLVLVGALAPRRLSPVTAPGNTAALLRPPIPSLEAMRREGVDQSDPVRFSEAFMRDFLLPLQVAEPAHVAKIPLDGCRFENEHPDRWIPVVMDHVFGKLGDYDYRPRMARVSAPVLVVHGDKERLPLQGSQDWAKAFPNARLLTVAPSGHFPFSEAPDVFFPAVVRFLGGDWPDGAILPA